MNGKTSENVERKSEIEKLQQVETMYIHQQFIIYYHCDITQKIAKLTENSEIKQDSLIYELKSETKTYKEMIRSLQREISILKDCKIKNSMSKQPQKSVSVFKKESKTSPICRCCMKLIKLLIGLAIFICFMVIFCYLVISTDLIIDNNNNDGLNKQHDISIMKQSL